MRPTLLLPLLLAPLAGGCSVNGGTAEAAGGGRPLTVEVVADEPTQGRPLPAEASVASTSAGTIVVEGTTPTPNPCYEFSGEARREGGAITLFVDAAQPPEMGCIQVIASFRYTATIRGVEAGEHEVRVVHRFPRLDRSDTVATLRGVRVP